MGCAARRQMRRGALGRGASLLLLPLLLLLAATGAAREPPDDCLLPCVVGRCRAAFPRWWYNATSQACQEFIFGGCGGNTNNFGSKKECSWTCVPGGEEETAGTPLTDQRGAEGPATAATTTSSHRRHHPAEDTVRFQEHCAAPRVTGRCRASFPRWFFDMESQTCKMFIYGGCGGNRNNYLLEGDCLSQCAAGGDSELPGEEDPSAHGRLFPDSALHSTRAVILAVLLALLLASLVLVVVRMCRRGRETSLSTVWSTVDDKELLMSSGYTL